MNNDCMACDGTGWVCEKCGTRWERADGTTCCGAGKPCLCNPSVQYEFDEIIAQIEEP